MTPQIIISLSPEGSLIAELPGASGGRRQIQLRQAEGISSAAQVLMETLRAFRDLEELTSKAHLYMTEAKVLYEDEIEHQIEANEHDPQRLRLLEKALAARNAKRQAQEKIQNLSSSLSEMQSALASDDSLRDQLRRILQAQLKNEVEIGLDGAPTQAQVRHWERHSIWSDPSCRFCMKENRFSTKDPSFSQRKKRNADLLLKRDGIEVRKIPAVGKARKKQELATSTTFSVEELGL